MEIQANSIEVKIKISLTYQGELPSYQTEHASGLDILAQNEQEIVLKPGERSLIPTGLFFEIPHGYEIQVRPRSGLAINSGISLVNSPGTIDADYRGEIKVILINHGQDDFVVVRGNKIAQIVVTPIVRARFTLSRELSITERGSNGFGSTSRK